jgi:hypothetical protein
MTREDLKGFLRLRDNYSNKSIEEFVKDKNETIKTIIYNGEVVQKFDPIFMDPKGKFVRAHFYAPRKPVFGYKIDTYIVNVVVLWIMTFFLYLALYFRLLKKILDSADDFFGKKIKNYDFN